MSAVGFAKAPQASKLRQLRLSPGTGLHAGYRVNNLRIGDDIGFRANKRYKRNRSDPSSSSLHEEALDAVLFSDLRRLR